MPVDRGAGTLPPMKKVQPSKVQPGFATRVAGFTVLELMIAVAVLGILLGIGVPSFQGMVRQNRLATQTNEFLAAAAMARSEAVKRGTTVTICPADPANANSCSGTDAWGNGWIVFADEEGTVGTIDINGAPDDVIIQRWPAATDRRITITNAGVTSLTYRGDGGTTLGAGTTSTFVVAPESNYCANPDGARNVIVTATGRVNATRRNCP